jgi:predicted AAA+ superfamily ATPase
MELNFQKIGRQIAKIEGGVNNGKIISVSTNDEIKAKSGFETLHLDEGKFQQIPNGNIDKDNKREILYITGQSGSGKSTYTRNYLKEYKKLFKKNNIYIFSALKSDKSIDDMKPQRINITDALVEDPLGVDDFEDSIVIFDDIDSIQNKKHREAVFKILNEIAQTGRHKNVSMIVTNHLSTGGRDTRTILNECNSVTYFPHGGSAHGINYLLENYVGIDRKTLKIIKKLKSRWITIYKNYPQIAMGEKDILLLSAIDD